MSDTATAISRVDGLGQTQEAAFMAIRAGNTFPQAAAAAGVSRATLYRWLQNDPHFRAAYNAWQQELAEAARARLLKLTDDAVDVVEGALRRKDEKVAVTMLQNFGVMRGVRRETTDPAVLALKMELRQKQREYRAATGMLKHVLTTVGLSPAQQLEYIRQHGVNGPTEKEPKARQLAATDAGEENPEPLGTAEAVDDIGPGAEAGDMPANARAGAEMASETPESASRPTADPPDA